jgi:hypothetical protein
MPLGHISAMSHYRGETMITESIVDHTQLEGGEVYGQIVYTYQSPTHWGSEGVCTVKVIYRGKLRPEARLSYSAGGHNKGFSSVEIADAMSEGFARAKKRLQVLSVNCNIN